jgi:hypothetical protein
MWHACSPNGNRQRRSRRLARDSSSSSRQVLWWNATISMMIQRVIKGISAISEPEARRTLAVGIVCNWWRKVDPLPRYEVPLRLTERNLSWHQNRYTDPDPAEGGEEFRRRTPFISTTARTVERNTVTNILTPAWQIALRFATDGWKTDGYFFYCYLLISGKRTVRHEAFAEELRELNVYTGFSPYHPEGEITAKSDYPSLTSREGRVLVASGGPERCGFERSASTQAGRYYYLSNALRRGLVSP